MESKDTMIKVLLNLDKPINSSQIGSKELGLDFNSINVSRAVKEMFDSDFKAQRKRAQQVQEYIFNSRMAQESSLTYPVLPYSEEYVNRIKRDFRQTVENLETENKHLNEDNDDLHKEKEMQAEQITQLSLLAEDYQNWYQQIYDEHKTSARTIEQLNVKIKELKEAHEIELERLRDQKDEEMKKLQTVQCRYDSEIVQELEVKNLIIKKKELHI